MTALAELVLVASVDRFAHCVAPAVSATHQDMRRFGFAMLAGCIAVMAGLARGEPVSISRKILPMYTLRFAPATQWPYCDFGPMQRLFEVAFATLKPSQQQVVMRHYVQYNDADDATAHDGRAHLAALSALDQSLRRLAWS